MSASRSASFSSMASSRDATAALEPSRFAWKSQRSVWEKMSSSPVIFEVEIPSSRPWAPLAMRSGATVKSSALTPSTSSAMSSLSWSASFFVCSVVLPPSHRSFSILWKTVHSWPSSRSTSRRSMRGSRSSGKDSAIGSMRS